MNVKIDTAFFKGIILKFKCHISQNLLYFIIKNILSKFKVPREELVDEDDLISKCFLFDILKVF